MRAICSSVVILTAIAISLFLCGTVLAQSAQGVGSNPDSAQSLAALWPLLGTSLATLAAYGLKYLSARFAFFHKPAGTAIITILGSTLSSITPLIQAGHFNWAMLAWAAMGAVSSFVATLNPSIAGVSAAAMSATNMPLPPANKQAGKISLVMLMVISAIGFGLAIAACGCATSATTAAYQAINNVTASADAGLKAFEAFDKDYQMQIVSEDKAAGKTSTAIEADLSTYRQKRAALNKAFAAVNAAVTTGQALLPLVDSGIKKTTDLSTWETQLLAAASALQQALADLGVTFGGSK